MQKMDASCDPAIAETIIRPFGPDDFEIIAEIYNESINAGGSTMDQTLKSPLDFKRQTEAFHSRETILVLEAAGLVLGWGIIKRYSDRKGYRTTCETAVYLHRNQARKGYGSRMKQALIDKCKEMGYRHLVAKILSVNTASIQYNTKLGYEIVGVQKQVGWANGRWQDVTIMQLILEDVAPPNKP